MPPSDSTTEAPDILKQWTRGDLNVLPDLMRRHDVLLLVLYGSTAKGTRHAESDLDFAVLFHGAPRHGSWYRDEIALEIALADLLKPTCELNLVALNRVGPSLLKEVADQGLVLYCDQPQRWTLYRIQAYRIFEDTEKYRRRRWKAFMDRYGSDARDSGASTETRAAR